MNKDFSVTRESDEKGSDTALDKKITHQVKKYKITIGDESYFLVSDEPEERLRMVARLVDTHMRLIAQQGHSDDPKRVAVLVALQCASKMVTAQELVEKCQEYQDTLLAEIHEKLEQL